MPTLSNKDSLEAKAPAMQQAGYLITFLHDLGYASTEFVVMDAQDFDRRYVAKVKLPQRVPFGFRGNWSSDASMSLT